MRSYLYNSDGFRCEGSVDDQGNIYESEHNWRIGRIDGDNIYDIKGIRLGRIDSDGRVWNIGNQCCGIETGYGFRGFDEHSSGIMRGGGYEGGRAYGALKILLEDKMTSSSSIPAESWLDSDDGGEDDDNNSYDGGDYDNSGRYNGTGGDDFDWSQCGCFEYCGCACTAILVIIFLIWLFH